MTGRLRTAAIALCVPVLFSASVALHGRLEERYPHFRPGPNDAFYLPRGELLRATTLGFRQLAADLLWIRVVQSVGDLPTRGEGFKYLREYVDLVTDLDPRYAPAYFIASHWLVSWQQVDEAIGILEKGRERFRDSGIDDYYKFPYYIGLDYFLWKRDKSKAVQYLREAAQVRAGGRDATDVALERLEGAGADTSYTDLLAPIIGEIDDPRERAAIEPLLRHGQLYDMVSVLNPMVERYRAERGRLPRSLDALVEAGWIRGVPPDPYAALAPPGRPSGLYIDAEGKVRSRVRPAYWWENSLTRPQKGTARD